MTRIEFLSTWEPTFTAVLGAIAAITASLSCSQAAETQHASLLPNAESYRELAGEIDQSLREQLLDAWYPRTLDRAQGGFFQRFGRDWTHRTESNKSVVYQARMTWTAAAAAGYAPDLHDEYLDYARHGLDFLDQSLQDGQLGGVYWQVDANGRAGGQFDTDKHAYGASFAIYAAAEVNRQTKDPQALELAKRTYRWLEEHAADSQQGGYFEALRRDGSPQSNTVDRGRNDVLGSPLGCKSMNSHIHVLEAYATLYEVWPDDALRAKLEQILAIVRDRIATEQGTLTLYLTPDWQRMSAESSFGHDVETAFLLTEASASLGRDDDEPTWLVARRLVDHALEWGWDDENGGFYDSGQTGQEAHSTQKIWWVQAEGLNALLLMHERYGHETDKYWQAFVRQWDFIQQHQIDAVHGGWYPAVSREGQVRGTGEKATEWQAAYHSGRAMMHAADRLRKMADPD